MEGYTAALTAAGATVLNMFVGGSYQGSWLARVRTADGREGWILDAYGSCSGCDAFESEFAYDRHAYYSHGQNVYAEDGNFVEGCSECDALKARLVEFGERYLAELRSELDIVLDVEGRGYIAHDDRECIEAALPLFTTANRARLKEALRKDG